MTETITPRLLFDLALVAAAVLALALYLRERRRSRGSEQATKALPPAVQSAEGDVDLIAASAGSPRSPINSTLAVSTTESVDAIVLGYPADPLLTIRPAPDLSPDTLEELPLTDDLRRNLQHLFEQAPRALIASTELGTELTTRRYLLVFSKDVRTKLSTGAYSYMPVSTEVGPPGIRPLAVDTRSRKIIEQGRLVRTINPAVVVGVAFQLASIATAQKYLADIEKRLAGIEQRVGELHRFQRHELDATVESLLRHVHRMANMIKSCDLTERNLAVYAIKLEDLDVDGGRIMGQLRRLFADEVAKFDALPSGGSAKEVLKTGLRCVEQAEAACKRYLVTAAIRVTGSEVRGGVGLHEEHALAILREVETDLVEFAKQPEQLVAAVPGAEAKLVRKYRTAATDKSRQAELRTAVEESAQRLKEGIDVVRGMIETTRVAIEEEKRNASKSASVEVTVDERGQITAARRLMLSHGESALATDEVMAT
jgi:hypothetical protein